METRFAGSRHVDERRRRRLASHALQEAVSEGTPIESAPTDHGGLNRKNHSDLSTVSHFPLRKLISPKAWKLWGIGLFGLLAGVALLRAGQFAAEAGTGISDGFVRLFDPANGRAFGVYGSVMFMLSGQLAMLIWWVRSRSPLDFGGRYRVWMTIAAAGVAASLLLITDCHFLIMDVIQRQTGINRGSQLELCWLVPAAMCAAFLLRMMHQEMRENRLSLVLLWTAAASGLLTTLQIAGFPVPGFEGDTQLTKAGTALFAQLGLMVSLLFHTRHVIYVSLDPPTKKSVREITKAANQNDADKSSLSKTTSATQAQQKRKSQEVLKDSPFSTNDSTVSQEEQRAAQIEEITQNLRVDEPIDNELLKGLSKKQRRKLRSQHRRMQRAAASPSPGIDDEN